MKIETSKVAFVIVGWNNKKLLEECINSILNQTHKFITIFYVDNNSNDGSVNYVKDNFPSVEVISTGENLGFAAGNNLGIARALKDKSIKYIGLLNTDARIESNWIETILSCAVLKPKGASFQTITLDYYNHSIIDSTHLYIAQNGQSTQGSWRRPLLDGYDVSSKKVFGCNAAAILISRAFIDEQPIENLFDEKMFMYLEDVDVAARANILGWDNYVVAGSRAYHMGSASSGKKPGYSLYMTYRNSIALLCKNMPLSLILRMLPSMIRSDIQTMKRLRQIGQSEGILKIIKGRIVGLVRLPIYMSDTFKLRKYKRSVSKQYLWRLMEKGF